jgi:hypothetical protein
VELQMQTAKEYFSHEASQPVVELPKHPEVVYNKNNIGKDVSS